MFKVSVFSVRPIHFVTRRNDA